EFVLLNPDSSKNLTFEESYKVDDEDGGRAAHCVLKPFLSRTYSEEAYKDEGFIKDDTITVEVRFWIDHMEGIKILPRFDFTDSNDPRHDITLSIEGEKIYASQAAILAANSPFFNSLFYGDFKEKNKEEIELNDIDREEFLELLHVIYPSRKPIRGDSAEYLLKLGDRFQIVNLIDSVEKFLINYNRSLSDMHVLRIADKYNLHALMERCLSNFETMEDFKSIEESSIFEDLSPKTSSSLLASRQFLSN
ncbi:hypothetical protein PMAYCL1PPCAC_24792, partial [Pristionchus mayeri]